MHYDQQFIWLAGGVLTLLVAASLAGYVLSVRVQSEAGRATVSNLNARTRAWWVMVAVFGAAIFLACAALLLAGAGMAIIWRTGRKDTAGRRDRSCQILPNMRR